MEEVLVIPDVHGRSFWEEAVKRYPEKVTIFLGDYHDPYPQDGITEAESLANMVELMEYTSAHPNCQLLLGNHDLHYLCNFGEACRMDYDHHETVRQLLRENLFRMAIATTREIGGKTVLFSHAPVLIEWLEAVGETDHLPTLCEHLNSLLTSLEKPQSIKTILGHTSPYRGGYDAAGSPIWADVREVLGSNTIIPTADYCVFGHTQVTEPIITPRWADLDCRKAFLLTTDLQLIEA